MLFNTPHLDPEITALLGLFFFDRAPAHSLSPQQQRFYAGYFHLQPLKLGSQLE